MVYDPRPSERWKQAQTMTDMFWARWIKEYVPTLQERQKWLYPKRNFAVGDLMLIVDESSSRGRRPLGLVEEVFPDAKGNVRRVVVRTAGAKRLQRDVRKLCLLEGDLSDPEAIQE